MKTSELREKSNEELQTLLTEELRSQFNLRMRKGTGQLDKPSEIKKTRRNIARINTILNENKSSIDKEKS